MIRNLTLALLLVTSGVQAEEIDEPTKIEALKHGYLLNGGSMVRWGSIDLTGPAQTKRMLEPDLPVLGPPAPPPAPVKPERKR